MRLEGLGMNEIRHLLAVAARRLNTSILLSKLHVAAFGVGVLALLLIVIDRLPAAPFLPWMWLAPVLIALALVVGVMMWLWSRPSAMHVAVVVDERLDLREKLSTALHVQDRDDPFARAAVDDAVRAAALPQNRELVRRRFGIEPPRGWWMSPTVVLLAMLASLLPPLDLFARVSPEQTDVTEAKLQAAEAIDSVVKSIEQQPELSHELSDVLDELSKEGTDPDAMRSPEEVRRDALKRVTDLNEKLEDLLSGERGKTADALERAMKQLESPEDGAAKELADAMASGDFKAAREALQELMDKMAQGEMSQEQMNQLAEQLAQLGQQLEQLAQQQKDLEDALRRAGMDPNLAKNPQALQQALQNNQNLNEQQKQQLAQMAKAQQAANQMCQGLGAACRNMANAMQSGQMGQAGQQMAGQLSEMEQLQMMLSQAQAAANACKGAGQGLGQGLSMQGSLTAMGQGMGQGQGGGLRPVAPTPSRTRMQQASGETGEGDIIARMLVDGPQIIGESRKSVTQVLSGVIKGYEEGLTEDQLPRKYHDSQKHYFGELEERIKRMSEQSDDEPADAPAEVSGGSAPADD